MNNKTILGPQSKIEIINDKHQTLVKKTSTKRGEKDLLDQINFYNNIPSEVSKYFIHMLEYNNNSFPYYYTYEFIDYTQLRNVLVNNQQFEFQKLNNIFSEIINTIHQINEEDPKPDYAFNLYLDRGIKRVNELSDMMGIDLLHIPIYNKKINLTTSLNEILIYFESIIETLQPQKVCTVHGQLGPAHIFMSEVNQEFKLIDPKGFDVLHDPVIDFCKLGKAMVYGTESIEVAKYNLKYTITDKQIVIENFEFKEFDREKMKSVFYNLMDKITDKYYSPDFIIRLKAMILSDLIGGLPFAYKTNGEERAIALLSAITIAIGDME